MVYKNCSFVKIIPCIKAFELIKIFVLFKPNRFLKQVRFRINE
jgi:hypothetical protein